MIIYQIRNKTNGKSYVGQSVHTTFNGRYSGGRWWQITDNPLLTKAAAKYGPDDFEVVILESGVESVEELNRLEIYHADRLNVYHPSGYNLRGCGDNRRLLPDQIDEIRRSKSKHFTIRKVDTWELIEVFNMKAFCRQNHLEDASMYNMMKKRGGVIVSHGYCLPERTKQEVSNRKLRTFRDKTIWLLDPDGNQIEVKDIRGFARDHELEIGSFYKLINGNMLHYKGYRLPHRAGEHAKTEGCYELRSPSGDIIKGHNLAALSREHGLNEGQMGKLARGIILEHRGWRLPNTTDEQVFMIGSKHRASATLLDPDGNEIHTDNLRYFCHLRGLRWPSFYSMWKGYTESAYGWQIRPTGNSSGAPESD